MVKPAYMIAIAAVLLAASFAGVVLIDDEADAAEGDEFKITFSISGSTIVQATENGQYTFKDVTDILGTYEAPTGYEATAWKDVNSSTVYQVGTPYTFVADVTVEPYLTVSGTVINLVYGEKTYTVADAGTTLAIDAEDIAAFAKAAGLEYDAKADTLLEMLSLDGTEFKGFAVEGAEDYITDLSELKLGDVGEVTYTAIFDKVFDVAFYFDKESKMTTVASNVLTVGTVPDAPNKANFIFNGWETADGVLVFTYDALNDKYIMKEGYKFESDLDLYADFDPIDLAVTLMVDGEVYKVAPAVYGEAMVEPALPEGYKYWAVQTKAPVYGEDGTTIVEEAEYAEFNFALPVTANMTLYAIEAEPAPVIPDEGYDVAFVKMIDGETIAINTITITEQNPTVTIPTGDAIAVDGKEFIGWFVGTQQVNPATYDITEDVTFVAMYRDAPEPVPEEPAFYETNVGMIAIFLVIVVIAAFIYAYMTNAYGLKDKLSFKIVRNGGDKKE